MFVYLGALGVLRAEPPNVLLIMVDDLKPTLGAYGDPVARTPNIDRLAERGVVFRRAVCQVSICGPSRASILTGLRPEVLECFTNADQFRRNDPDAVSLPRALGAAGYRTVSIGKVFDGRNRDPGAWDEELLKSTEKTIYALEENGRTFRENEERYKAATSQERRKLWRVGPPVERGGAVEDHYDGRIANLAVEKLRELKDRRFFLAVGFIKPHLPFSAPSEYWDLYDREAFDLPELREAPDGALEIAYHEGFELRQYDGVPKQGVLEPDLARELIHGYYACTSFADAMAGRVLDELQSLGLSGNTIVVLMGDHGFHLGDKGVWCKFTSFREAAVAPLLVVDPRRGGGGVSDALVEFIDVYPTVCELAGVDPPDRLEGVSLVPLLDDPASSGRDVVYTVSGRGNGWREYLGTAACDGKFSYIAWRHRESGALRAEELYNLETDPGEAHNLAGDARHAGALEAMRALAAGGMR